MVNMRVVGRRALIGHTGFVGGCIDKLNRFTDRYNSKNIETMSGHYQLIVCSGARGKKWLANLDPNADASSIARLCKVLKNVTADRFVLISTIDADRKHPYAVHRKALESFVATYFPGASIMRLPALFGKGLKKNILFELLSGRGHDTPRKAKFHWYDLSGLWYDIEHAKPGLSTYYSPPIAMGELMDDYFEDVPIRNYEVKPDYDYAEPPPYNCTEEEILTALGRFITNWRNDAVHSNEAT